MHSLPTCIRPGFRRWGCDELTYQSRVRHPSIMKLAQYALRLALCHMPLCTALQNGFSRLDLDHGHLAAPNTGTAIQGGKERSPTLDSQLL